MSGYDGVANVPTALTSTSASYRRPAASVSRQRRARSSQCAAVMRVWGRTWAEMPKRSAHSSK